MHHDGWGEDDTLFPIDEGWWSRIPDVPLQVDIIGINVVPLKHFKFIRDDQIGAFLRDFLIVVADDRSSQLLIFHGESADGIKEVQDFLLEGEVLEMESFIDGLRLVLQMPEVGSE